MNALDVIKKRRKQEHVKGDIRKACEKSGLTPVVFQTALKKQKIEDLNDKELCIVEAYLEILNERIRERNRLKEIILSDPDIQTVQ